MEKYGKLDTSALHEAKPCDLSIIIVNYNTSYYTLNCVKSLREYEKNDSYEIIIVDNNSDPYEKNKLSESPLNFFLVTLEKNYGFGFACNIGAELSKARYVLFLNPDITLYDSSVSKLFEYAVSNDVPCVTGLLVSEKLELQYCFNNFPDIKWEFAESFGLGRKKIMDSLLSRSEIKNNLPFVVDWAHGACLLFKKDVFCEVGGFDERIFLYYEDVDIQFRLNRLGYKIICLPDARFIHLERSSVRDNIGLLIYSKNMHHYKLYYYTKNKGHTFALFIRTLYITGYILRIFLLPFRRRKNKEGLADTAVLYSKILLIYLFDWRVS